MTSDQQTHAHGDDDRVDRRAVRDVLDQLVREGLLPSSDDAAARTALTTLEASHMPWFLRLLIGFGAWAGAGFFLSFVLGLMALVLGKQFNTLAVGLGVLFIAGSIPLRRRMTASTVGALFGRQLALVTSFTGQMLFVGGLGDLFDSVTLASAAVLAVSALLIATFPDRVQRFCSVAAAVGALLTICFEMRLPHGVDAIALGLIAGPLVLWRALPRAWATDMAEIVEPAVYALMLWLFGLLLFHTFFDIIGLNPNAWFRMGPAVTIGLVVALLWLVCAIFNEHGVSLGSLEVALACGVIVLLGYVTRTTPAIVATVLATLLGFDRHARALIALAALFFIVFASFYYYSLQLTLMQKSAVLMASGAVCLAAAAFVRWRSVALRPRIAAPQVAS